MKSFNKPPNDVITVMAAVATVLGEVDTDWAACRKLLGKSNFMVRLADCNATEAAIANL